VCEWIAVEVRTNKKKHKQKIEKNKIKTAAVLSSTEMSKNCELINMKSNSKRSAKVRETETRQHHIRFCL